MIHGFGTFVFMLHWLEYMVSLCSLWDYDQFVSSTHILGVVSSQQLNRQITSALIYRANGILRISLNYPINYCGFYLIRLSIANSQNVTVKDISALLGLSDSRCPFFRDLTIHLSRCFWVPRTFSGWTQITYWKALSSLQKDPFG